MAFKVTKEDKFCTESRPLAHRAERAYWEQADLVHEEPGIVQGSVEMKEMRYSLSANQSTGGVRICTHSDFMAICSKYDLQSVKNGTLSCAGRAQQETPLVVQYLLDDSKRCVRQGRLRSIGNQLVPLHFSCQGILVKWLCKSAFVQSVPVQPKLWFEALPPKARTLLAEWNLMPRSFLELEHLCVCIVLVALLIAQRQEFKPRLRWAAVE